MSQATFSQSAKNAIREKYLRCVICLNHTSTAQCAHIIDAASPGRAQVCHKIITYDRLALVFLSFAEQSNSAFCLKIMRGMQREMAYFVSGDHHSLQTLINWISQSVQIATPISLRILLSFLSQSLSWSTSISMSDILRRPAGNPYALCRCYEIFFGSPEASTIRSLIFWCKL